MARKLIVTADDYGYTDHIDHGILDAVKQGRVTTVSCFTNIPKSQLKRNIEKLKVINPNVGMGVHLTITSMQPLTNAPSMRDPKNIKYFQIPKKYNLRKVDLKELELELRTQIRRLADLIGMDNIDHLNNHHNFLYLHQPMFHLLTDLAYEYGIPIRSPRSWSKSGKKFFFYKDFNPLTKHAVEAEAIKSAPLKNIFMGIKAVSKKAIQHNLDICLLKEVKHPDLFMDQIYGQPYISDWKKYWQEIESNEVIEQIMHLSCGCSQQEYYKPPIGVARRYFKGRKAEYDTLTGEMYEDAIKEEMQASTPLKMGTYRSFLG